jgi:hypothetical protein
VICRIDFIAQKPSSGGSEESDFRGGAAKIKTRRRIIKRHEGTFLTFFAQHPGFKGINVGTTDFVFLF